MKISLLTNFDIHSFLLLSSNLLFLQKVLSPNTTLFIIFKINIFLFKLFSSIILSNNLIAFIIKLSGNLISANKSHILLFKSLSPSFKISNNKLNLSSSKQITSSLFLGSFFFFSSISCNKLWIFFSSAMKVIAFSASPLNL